MRDHLRSELDTIVGSMEVDPGRVAQLLGDAVRRAGDVARGRSDMGLHDLFATPEQREIIDRVTGVMSLL
jgi:hypothetical protein